MTTPLEPVVRNTDDREAERAAMTAAFEEHQRGLFAFALRVTADVDTAEDAVAEAFARLLRERRSGRWPDRTGGWLFRVTANVIHSGQRRRAVARRWQAILGRRHAPLAEDPEAGFLRREQQTELERALAVVSPDARMALLLAANGYHGVEIAEAIGRSESATRTLLCRARQRIRETFEAQETGR